MVEPTKNEEPGACERIKCETWFDASVAVGSCHCTLALVVPSSTTAPIFVGQLEIVGGVLSTREQNRRKQLNGALHRAHWCVLKEKCTCKAFTTQAILNTCSQVIKYYSNVVCQVEKHNSSKNASEKLAFF